MEFFKEIASASNDLRNSSSNVLSGAAFQSFTSILTGITFMKSVHGHGLSYREADLQTVDSEHLLKQVDVQGD